jgi:hypothetical protein
MYTLVCMASIDDVRDDLAAMNGYDYRLDLGQRIDNARKAELKWSEIAELVGMSIDGCRKARDVYLTRRGQ